MRDLRYEVKMTTGAQHLSSVRAWVILHPEAFIQAYPRRQVNSLYFDTHDVGCLTDNLFGVSDRTKLRFRWYGDGFRQVRGHLELKGKRNQLGWKEGHPIPLTFDLTAISWRDLIEQLRGSVPGALSVWLRLLGRPTLISGYLREYYESRDHQIRLTIDYNLVAYEQITYHAPNIVHKAPILDQVVVEVKADASLHRRVSDVLSSSPLQVSRNSKYVNSLIDSFCFT